MNKITDNIKKAPGKFFGRTFALYTCISYGMMVLNILTVNAQAPEWSGVALLFSHILLFSALTALIFTVVGLFERLNSAIAQLIKFVFTYGAFYLCFFALQRETAQPINIVTVSAAFVVVYAAVVGALSALRVVFKKCKNENTEYVSVYSDLKSEREDR